MGRSSGSGRFADLASDKVRGGYYTPAELAAWICRWAIRDPSDHVLEPSCGDGQLVEAAARRLVTLGASPADAAARVTGIEVEASQVAATRARVRRGLGVRATHVAQQADFFEWWSRPRRPSFDVVVGNPPFIRYQSFPEPHRSRAMSLMADLGLAPNRLTNIWVPFVAAAVASLRAGGRLGLVLPAELLQVGYAAQLRSYLTDRFRRLDIVTCNDLFFENAEQEVVLVLATGARPDSPAGRTCRVAMTEVATVRDVTRRSPRAVLAAAAPKTVRHDREKWLKYFLSAREIAFLRELRGSDVAAPLAAHASVDVGVVTGKNEFFVLTSEAAASVGGRRYTVPLVSRTAHLRGASIARREWRALAAAGDRVHLLHLAPHGAGTLPPSLRAYVRSGARRGFDRGYKCSIREPWYAVPSVWVPSGFLFRQIYDFPRAVLNRADATSTDTIHRLRCKSAPRRTIASLYTHLTAASAEVEGRSYGGGVLELEPTEAERLLSPARLGGGLPLAECDRLVRAGQIERVLLENDRLVLQRRMGLSTRECTLLRSIWVKMRDRRMARRRSGR